MNYWRYHERQKRHPDSTQYHEGDILPGSCNNLNDVKEYWERINLSYAILSNKQLRNKYDRHETLSDPREAM